MPIANEDVVARVADILARTEKVSGFSASISCDDLRTLLAAAAPIERMREALAAADERIADLKEWALEKCRQHHQLAADDEYLRMEHIATSSAYRELALEIEARVTLSGAQNNG